MTSELYVYYKIATIDGPAWLPLLRQMQAALAQQGVEVSLMRRQDDNAQQAQQTWMEVYRGIADEQAFLLQLQQALHDHGLESLGGARHMEWFVPLEG
ncbi:DUF4936 family protein [Aquitalea pelogenes]|uniref:DUF4936 family protein n=1 Tax=Aquitalea pelogenes TaxID=1293573 RepID=UPI000787FA64|nr:DUF4936 family protein [Aquitalea pelogenes]